MYHFCIHLLFHQIKVSLVAFWGIWVKLSASCLRTLLEKLRHQAECELSHELCFHSGQSANMEGNLHFKTCITWNGVTIAS